MNHIVLGKRPAGSASPPPSSVFESFPTVFSSQSSIKGQKKRNLRNFPFRFTLPARADYDNVGPAFLNSPFLWRNSPQASNLLLLLPIVAYRQRVNVWGSLLGDFAVYDSSLKVLFVRSCCWRIPLLMAIFCWHSCHHGRGTLSLSCTSF